MNRNKPHNYRSLIGQTFGKWTVLEDSGRRHEKVLWRCRCECGVVRLLTSQMLKNGNSSSCGCSRGASYTLAGHTSGGARSPEYASWVAMRSRCNNQSATHYARYGGRGIRVCPQWDTSFEQFMKDMGPAPKGKETIDRYPDKNGNYEPGNCRWASRKEQANNRSHNIKWEHRARDSSGRFT